MNWNDLKTSWQNQRNSPPSEAELTSMRRSVDKSVRRAKRALLAQDIVWAMPGILGFGAFAIAGWVTAATISLALGIALLFFFKKAQRRCLFLGANASLLEKVEADIAALQYRRRLLFNIPIWYLSPAVGAVITPVVAPWIRRIGEKQGGLQSPLVPIAIVVFVVTFLIRVVWLMCVLTDRKKIAPALAELEEQHQELLNLNGQNRETDSC